ncbi:MAG: translation initiation factor IF-2 [Clostridiales Family XIII bacterium]|jgi:translation initiation factor IF-2|nr:translation initiation factor IF-2 [Clostridiales Family XIII bacterium]
MRIHELAKQLNLSNKDVLARAQAMGLGVTSASSSVSDGEAATLKDRILGKDRTAAGGETAPIAAPKAQPKSAPKGETTIVRVKPKVKETEKKQEVHVTKKANVKLPLTPPRPKTKSAEETNAEAAGKGEARTPVSGKPPVGASSTPPPPPPSRASMGASASRSASVAPAPAPAPRAASGAPVPRPRVTPGALAPSSGSGDKADARTEISGEGKRKPLLKVAYTDQEPEPKPAIATQPGAAGKTEAESKPGAATSPEAAIQSEAEAKSDTTTQPESEARRAEAAAKARGEASEAEVGSDLAPGSTSASEAARTGGRKEKPQASESAGRAGKAAKTDGAKRPAKTAKDARGKTDKTTGAAGSGEGDKAKKDGTAAKGKAKEKKGHKGKEQKGDAFGDKNKRHNVRDAKRRGATDDFRGSKRSPILEDSSLEKRPLKSGRRPKVQPKAEPELVVIPEDLAPGTKIIAVPITVAGFAEQVEKTPSEVIMALMSLGLMMNINSNLDETTALLLSDELGVPVFIALDEGEIIEEGIEDFEDDPANLIPRPPVITVMGHVDHGKTSLLDAIRETNVTEGEAGGITQHIGASEVHINDQRIVFLDTPGHEAFTAMRARGAHATDIAVLVVAADDGVMPQTLESISHAKAAGVPIVVAINKMDKEGANPDRVKQELSEHGVLVEDWGGDTQSVNVSAKSRQGIKELLEAIVLQSEVLELKANPNRLALGTVIEARLDKARGSVATLLVLNGTLEAGMSIVAGMTSGRIRAMTDYKGKEIQKAGPATAVEVTGLSEVPQAGDEFNAVREDRVARAIAENRKLRQRDEIMARTSGASLDTLFERMGAGETKELNIIIKGDVQGSVGALTASLEQLSNDEVKINIIHKGVGAVNESDVMLAETSKAVVIGFNVRPGSSVTALAERDGVEIRTYRVIYDAIDDVKAAMKGMLDPEFREVVIGKLEIRETFKVPGVGTIGGAYVTEGKVQRSAEVRAVRDGIVVHEGRISSLKRFKDDVREVATGYECGIGIDNYNDIKVGDIIEAFVMEEIERE